MHARFARLTIVTRLTAVAVVALALSPLSSRSSQAAAPSPRAARASAPSLEEAVLAEVNRMRADPAGYARFLEATRPHYRGALYVRGGGLAPIKTVEGVAAVDEAIAALLAAPGALPPLSSSAGLASAARDHVRDEGPTGVVGHKGTDGSNSFQRIQRHGRTRGLAGEVIDYGWSSARDIVMDLLVDDGVANRGHRKALLRSLYAQAGVACGAHARFGVMCVMDMAESFTPGRPGEGAGVVVAAAPAAGGAR